MKMKSLTNVEQAIVVSALEVILERVSGMQTPEQSAAFRQACEDAGEDVVEVIRRMVRALHDGSRLMLLDPEGEKVGEIAKIEFKGIPIPEDGKWRDN